MAWYPSQAVAVRILEDLARLVANALEARLTCFDQLERVIVMGFPSGFWTEPVKIMEAECIARGIKVQADASAEDEFERALFWPW